tara:strand:- start:34 stop:387 length:354 start_codon:yes stop_codon:yes gene_type:complete
MGAVMSSEEHSRGYKADEGKPRVGLMLAGFSRALLEVSKVTTEGAERYRDFGFLAVDAGAARYDDAKGRHLLEGYVSESKHHEDEVLGHMAAEAWNALCVLELTLREKEEQAGTQAE